jgi:hypothetical protein
VVTEDFLEISQEVPELQKYFVHLTSNVREDNENGMYIGKNLPDVRKNVFDLTEE